MRGSEGRALVICCLVLGACTSEKAAGSGGHAAASTGGATSTGGMTSTGGGGATSTGGVTSTGGAPGTGGAPATGGAAGSGYDVVVLADGPVAFWAMKSGAGTEPDLTGNGNTGTYKKGPTALATLPNGDRAADFDGASQYLTVPSNRSFSIPTTGDLTWEAWIKPDVLQFPHASDDYVDWMGKCEDYAPTCEWEARMYSTTTSETRPNRLSAYVFNSSAMLGSAADWQPVTALITAGSWYHVVGEYTLHTAPADCMNTAMYPGSINIWVNGVAWNHGSHGQTGCMSEYNVVPTAASSPLDIGTMGMDTWFPGAIGKVALYDRLLTAVQITTHYQAMTGKTPTGTCGDSCSF
jgi:hypothetical protein